ncbi:hypothetical protein [Lacticaseibacillus sp. N501-2]|uniref:hypothetical protein n=1 Tax=Lacticaseibacillus salsurae TaxID=3367729 RepID=UPI0038B3D100
MNKEKSTSSGTGFLGMLTILFIGLKLTHVIAWSWWLVLLPELIPVTLILIALAAQKIVEVMSR